jgi:glycosyltransferase involved in cell wall biosynthesis
MRVVHVINQMALGGAEKQIEHVMSHSSLEHRVIEYDRLANGSALTALRALRRELVAEDPDVVVAWLDRSQIAVAAVSGRAWARIASVRGPPQRRGSRRAPMLWLALARYDHVVTNSEALRDATIRFAHPRRLADKCSVLPNGVEEQEISSGTDGHGFRIGYVGRANYWKGVDILLDAFTRLDMGDAYVTLVGAAVPAAVARSGAPRARITAVDRVPNPWERLGPVDVLVVPSRIGSEGSPNVVLEAFARRIPVIGTPDPGALELLRDGRGVVVPPEDPDALAAALTELRREPAAAQQRAEAARRFVLEEHGWGRVISKWDAAIASAAAKNVPGSS